MRGKLNVFLILNCMLLCIYLTESVAAEQGPIVDTKFGEVEGYFTENNKVFKGIPYAGSVSGQNRWKDAEFPQPWRPEILDATSNPPKCPQMGSGANQNEDCLFLNVYTPLNAMEVTDYPVLIFIHGGAFLLGDASMSLYDGSYLAATFEIVVVNIQYRLGSLGFLVYGSSDGEPTIKGNFGIKDQILALQWVQENIHAFGGNKDDVTISGQSAGAMSVAIHMTRENCTHLFHKAILESELFGISYHTVDSAKTLGDTFAEHLECDTVECLREKDCSDILSAQGKVFPVPTRIWNPMLPWAPVVDPDGDLITKQPLESFQSGHVIKVPTLMGTTNGEGIMFIYGALFMLPVTGPIPKFLYDMFIFMMFGMDFHNYWIVHEQYPGSEDPGYDHGLLMSEIATDYAFYCPTVLAAQSSSSADNPVYSYVFDQPWNITMGIPKVDVLCGIYACHGSELPYAFHSLDDLGKPEEKELAGTVSNYWGTFITTGDPNSSEDRKQDEDDGCNTGSLMSATYWPPNTGQERFVDLKMFAPNPEVAYDDRKEKCVALSEIGYGPRQAEAMHKAIIAIYEALATPQG